MGVNVFVRPLGALVDPYTLSSRHADHTPLGLNSLTKTSVPCYK